MIGYTGGTPGNKFSNNSNVCVRSNKQAAESGEMRHGLHQPLEAVIKLAQKQDDGLRQRKDPPDLQDFTMTKEAEVLLYMLDTIEGHAIVDTAAGQSTMGAKTLKNTSVAFVKWVGSQCH